MSLPLHLSTEAYQTRVVPLLKELGVDDHVLVFRRPDGGDEVHADTSIAQADEMIRGAQGMLIDQLSEHIDSYPELEDTPAEGEAAA